MIATRCHPGSKPSRKAKHEGFCVVIWSALAELRCATCGELAAALKKPKKNVAPRLTDLQLLGQIEDSGDRRGGGRRGPRETVWRIVHLDQQPRDGAGAAAPRSVTSSGLFEEYGFR